MKNLSALYDLNAKPVTKVDFTIFALAFTYVRGSTDSGFILAYTAGTNTYRINQAENINNVSRILVEKSIRGVFK